MGFPALLFHLLLKLAEYNLNAQEEGFLWHKWRTR